MDGKQKEKRAVYFDHLPHSSSFHLILFHMGKKPGGGYCYCTTLDYFALSLPAIIDTNTSGIHFFPGRGNKKMLQTYVYIPECRWRAQLQPINLKLLMQANVTHYAGMLTHNLSFHEVLTSHHGGRHLLSGMVTGPGNLACDVHLCLPTHFGG